MISTITNYSDNIDTLYPISGQDNDSQGFRDNFTNIRQALNNAANEINTLSLDLSPTVQKTVLMQNSLGPVRATTLGISSATLSLGQNQVDPSRSQPILNIAGVDGVSINDGTTAQVKIMNPHSGDTWPYTNAFVVDHPEMVTIGATFKFFADDTITYTVLDVNSTTVYVNSQFDPVFLYSKGVSTGTTLTLNNGKLAGGIFQVSTPPTSPVGGPGDQKGALYISTGSVQICTGNFDGTTKIWQPLNTNVETNVLGVLKADPNLTAGSTSVYICDLSKSSRFFINDSGTNGAHLNFINIPPIPFQVESFVTIGSVDNTNTATSIPLISIENGPPLTPMDIGFGTLSSGATWNMPLPTANGKGFYKHWITIMCDSTGSYNIFLITGVF